MGRALAQPRRSRRRMPYVSGSANKCNLRAHRVPFQVPSRISPRLYQAGDGCRRGSCVSHVSRGAQGQGCSRCLCALPLSSQHATESRKQQRLRMCYLSTAYVLCIPTAWWGHGPQCSTRPVSGSGPWSTDSGTFFEFTPQYFITAE